MQKIKPNSVFHKIWHLLKAFPYHKVLHLIVYPFRLLFSLVGSWWHILIALIFGLIFLYYPIGGLLISNIDNNPNVEIKHQENGFSSTIDTMAYIIDTEVNQNFWTPSLPFFFPSYFLDNMPNYQLGKMAATARFIKCFESHTNKNHDTNFTKATELLQYPGTIWMFSPENKITPVPSAGSQYRKARKHLIKYNTKLEQGSNFLTMQKEDLVALLKSAAIDLNKSTTDLEAQIREHASSGFDFKADDVFYYNQGKIYAYYLLFEAISYDYKDIIVSYNLYPEWIKMLKALEHGTKLNSWLIRNGDLNSVFAANHLQYLAFYSLKASHQMQSLILLLNQKQQGKHP